MANEESPELKLESQLQGGRNDTTRAAACVSHEPTATALHLNNSIALPIDSTPRSSSSLSTTVDQKERGLGIEDPRIQAAAASVVGETSAERHEELSDKRKTIIVCALCLCVLMAAMDQTIVTTAVPTIVERFKSPSAYTWIGAVFVLLASAFLPSWGKFSDIFGRKPVLLLACMVFLFGSVLCAAAQNIITMLAGRAIQGLAAGGLIGLVNVVISDLVPVRERGMYFAFVGCTWAFSSAIGPILGGLFTQYATWRLCFLINVPLSLAAMTALLFLLHLHSPTIAIMEGMKRVDWLGTILIVSGTILFLLGLQFGGVSHPWSSPVVLCLIIFGVIIMAAFILVEWEFTTSPLMPPRLFAHRTAIAGYLTCFFHGFVFMGGCYFLPLYFQAVRGSSVLMSGVYVLPYVISLSIASAITGRIISLTGSYREVVWAGVTLMTLGSGLLSNLDRTSNWAKIILYQLIAGIGAGPLFQGPLIAIHSVIEQKDVATATVTFAFIRNLSTALGISLGLVVFQNVMNQQAAFLHSVLTPEALKAFSGSNASASVPFINNLPSDQAILVRDAYGKCLQAMWYFFFACSIAAWLFSLGMGKHHLSTVVQSAQPAKRKRNKSKDIEAALQEKS